MSDATTFRADYAVLNDLIVNCPDFEHLEALLGGFNLFQVLDFEHGEIRHSNVLAWILDPAQSHGLDDSFLKKWLMRVIHESTDETGTAVAAVDIDGWQLAGVEVRREEYRCPASPHIGRQTEVDRLHREQDQFPAALRPVAALPGDGG